MTGASCRRVGLTLGLLLTITAAAEPPRPAEFAYTVPLIFTPGSALYAARLPASIYARSVRPDLADVRVFNGAGEPVPHALRLPAPAPVTEPAGRSLPLFPVTTTSTTSSAPEALEIRVDRSGALMRLKAARGDARSLPARYVIDASRLEGDIAFLVVRLERSEADVFARVDVEGSDDLKEWRTVTRGVPLVQMRFNGAELRELRIPLTGGRTRYLRLVPVGDELSTRIARVEAVAPRTSAAPPRESVVVAGNRGESEGEYRYEAQGTYPADRVYIEPAADNTVMPFELDGRDSPSDPWSPVAHGTAYRLLHQGVKLASASFPVSGRWHRTYRLRFTSAPIPTTAPALRFEWTPAEIVFAAQGNPPFVLAYGQAGARSAALPLNTLVPGLGTRAEVKPAVATVGSEVVAAGNAATAARPDYRKWGVWSAMILGALVIGAMALKLVRDTGRTDGPPR
ncbi:MAG: DUF3999 domain-containing protein [Burkholderiales bacterium]